MASSNEYSRKILNSPNHAEPCIVNAGKQILLPDNWYVALCLHLLCHVHRSPRVFLTGKAHVGYRKVLNTLMTRNALS